MDTSYWLKQTENQPFFPDIEWSKPEQKSRAGKLMVIGGHGQGFIAVAESFALAEKVGVGSVRALMPDSLKKDLPHNLTEATLLPSNPSGGFSKDAYSELLAAAKWADAILLPGDLGRNSETAMLVEKLLAKTEAPITLTRDAVDIVSAHYSTLVERPNTLLVLSFAQAQKLFKSVYYPKVLTFSMPLLAVVEALHKFTLTYPINLMVFHNDTMIVASQGRVSTTSYTQPMSIWRGITASKATAYWLWNPKKPFEATTSSLLI